MYNYTYIERENGADLRQFSSYESWRALAVFYVSCICIDTCIYIHIQRERAFRVVTYTRKYITYIYIQCFTPPFRHSRICVLNRNTSCKVLQKKCCIPTKKSYTLPKNLCGFFPAGHLMWLCRARWGGPSASRKNSWTACTRYSAVKVYICEHQTASALHLCVCIHVQEKYNHNHLVDSFFFWKRRLGCFFEKVFFFCSLKTVSQKKIHLTCRWACA